MRFITLLASFAFISNLGVAQNQISHQTAREALVEMFLSKDAAAFEKHLPNTAKQVLMRKGETPETSVVQKIAMLGRQLTQSESVETFTEGSTLLISEHAEGAHKQKVEISLERDSTSGESEEVEVSVHVYRDGQPVFLPALPDVTFAMIQEKEIWKLSEVTISAHIPLTDPEYLKGVRKEANEADEKTAAAHLGMLVASETQYAAQHAGRGYTCRLADVAANPGGDASSTPPAANAGSDVSGDESSGYKFSVSECNGNPVSKFQIAAVPVDSGAGMKALCTDEAGAIRFDPNGSSSRCFSEGKLFTGDAISSQTE